MASSRNIRAFSDAFWMGEWDKGKSIHSEGGADLNLPDSETGFSWLHVACRMGNVDIARWLVGQGADVDAEVVSGATDDDDDYDDLGATPLMLVVDSVGGSQRELMELLLDAGSDINHIDALGQNIVHRALEAPDLLAFALERGADPNVTAADGETPLARALLLGDDALADALRAAGALDIDTTDIDFQRSVFEGNRTRVSELLAAGANVNYQRDGTALGTAVYREDIDLLRLLVEAGADVNLAETNDADGDFNPLLKAAYSGQKDIVAFLLESDADVSVSNHGLSPLDYAKMGKREGRFPERPWDDVIALLRSAARNSARTLRGKAVTASEQPVIDGINGLLSNAPEWSRFHGAGVDILESDAIVDAGGLGEHWPALQRAAREQGYSLLALAWSLREAEPRLGDLEHELSELAGTTADAVFDAWQAERLTMSPEPAGEVDEYDWAQREKVYASLDSIPKGVPGRTETFDNGVFLVLTRDVATIPVAYRFGGWNSAPLPQQMGLVAQHWLDAYAAELVAIDNATMTFHLPRPIDDVDKLKRAAREIGLFCDESESAHDDIRLAAGRRWSFWWD